MALGAGVGVGELRDIAEIGYVEGDEGGCEETVLNVEVEELEDR